MMSARTYGSSARSNPLQSAIKCPQCMALHPGLTEQEKKKQERGVRRGTKNSRLLLPFQCEPHNRCSHHCQLVYVTAECPVCFDTADSPVVTFPCGHIVCKEHFQYLGGTIGNGQVSTKTKRTEKRPSRTRRLNAESNNVSTGFATTARYPRNNQQQQMIAGYNHRIAEPNRTFGTTARSPRNNNPQQQRIIGYNHDRIAEFLLNAESNSDPTAVSATTRSQTNHQLQQQQILGYDFTGVWRLSESNNDDSTTAASRSQSNLQEQINSYNERLAYHDRISDFLLNAQPHNDSEATRNNRQQQMDEYHNDILSELLLISESENGYRTPIRTGPSRARNDDREFGFANWPDYGTRSSERPSISETEFQEGVEFSIGDILTGLEEEEYNSVGRDNQRQEATNNGNGRSQVEEENNSVGRDNQRQEATNNGSVRSQTEEESNSVDGDDQRQETTDNDVPQTEAVENPPANDDTGASVVSAQDSTDDLLELLERFDSIDSIMSDSMEGSASDVRIPVVATRTTEDEEADELAALAGALPSGTSTPSSTRRLFRPWRIHSREMR